MSTIEEANRKARARLALDEARTRAAEAEAEAGRLRLRLFDTKVQLRVAEGRARKAEESLQARHAAEVALVATDTEARIVAYQGRAIAVLRSEGVSDGVIARALGLAVLP